MTIFLTFLAFLFGSLICYRGFQVFQLGKKTARWPTTVGYVASANLSTTSRYGLIGQLIFQTYFPVIHYNYTVNGTEFYSEEVSPAGVIKFESYFGIPGSKRAEAFLSQFAENTKITVHYNPEQHSQALLIPKVSFWSWLPEVLAGFILIILPFIV